MRRQRRRIAHVGSPESGCARRSARQAHKGAGGVGCLMGGHRHQRKLWSLPEIPAAIFFGADAPVLGGAQSAWFAPRASGISGFRGPAEGAAGVKFLKSRGFPELFRKIPSNASGGFAPVSGSGTALASSPCDVAHEPAHRKRFLTMHECGEKENPWLTPTQCSIETSMKD